MLPQDPEPWLMAAVVALHLYDAMLLLYGNEAVLARGGGGTWRVLFGSTSTTLRGKQVLFPNLLLPVQPLFRLAWSHEPATEGAAADFEKACVDLKALVPLVWSLFVVSFVGLPVALFGRFGDFVILAVLIAFYGLVIGVVIAVWCLRARWQLDRRAAGMLALDLLLCPPFALNIIRRLSLRVSGSADLVASARRLLAPEAWEQARAELLARQDDEIAIADANSPRIQALVARREQLVSM